MGTKTYRRPHVFRWEWGKWGPKPTDSLMFLGGSGESGDQTLQTDSLMFLGGSGESGDQNLQTDSLMFLGGSGESGDQNLQTASCF